MPTDDILPADPRARRLAVILWVVAATLGTAAVWWLSSYIESLTVLGRTDRDAAAALFRSRVLPALWAVALVSVVAGAVLARQGWHVLRAGRFFLDGTRLVRNTPRQAGGSARVIGIVLVTAGVLMALLPLAVVGLVTWALG
jgi:hypothetical protein